MMATQTTTTTTTTTKMMYDLNDGDAHDDNIDTYSTLYFYCHIALDEANCDDTLRQSTTKMLSDMTRQRGQETQEPIARSVQQLRRDISIGVKATTRIFIIVVLESTKR